MANPFQNISEQVKRQMNQPQIHDAWERNYRGRENERFFEQAYDDFVVRLAQPPVRERLISAAASARIRCVWHVVATSFRLPIIRSLSSCKLAKM